MAANTQQIVSGQVVNGGVTLKTGLTNFDGTDTLGTALQVLWTAGAGPNNAGGRLERIRFKPRPVSSGSTAANNAQTMAWIFLNNGSANTTAANNQIFATVPLPATTVVTAAGLLAMLEPNIIELPVPPQLVLPFGSDVSALPAAFAQGYRILVGLGTTVAAGWDVTAFGGAY